MLQQPTAASTWLMSDEDTILTSSGVPLTTTMWLCALALPCLASASGQTSQHSCDINSVMHVQINKYTALPRHTPQCSKQHLQQLCLHTLLSRQPLRAEQPG